MSVSREDWKDFALRGASLIFEVLLEDVYSQGRMSSPDCPYTQFLQDVEKAKVKDKKKKRVRAAKTPYLPNQRSFAFDD